MLNKYVRSGYFSGSILVFILLFSKPVFCCGSGIIPYVPSVTAYNPTESGSLTSGKSSGQFYLIEKGVSSSMFDIKRLQPLIRNVILTGNERTKHGTSGTATSSPKEAKPILNIHRLH